MGYFLYPTNLPGLAYSIIRRPKHNVSVQTHQSGGEVRMSYWTTPLWEWDLTYEVLRDGFRMGRAWNEMREIMGLFLNCTGTLKGFQFRDVDDHSITQGLLGTTNGTSTTYGLVRNYGSINYRGDGLFGTEFIGFLDTTQPFNLYIDDTLVDISDPTYGYSLNTSTPCNQQLVFNSAPPSGHVITCDMSYLYYARFQAGSQDFEKFMHQLWALKKVTLCSLRY